MDGKIDFDEASKAWRANKKKIGQLFVYICTYIHSNGKRCRRTIENNIPENIYKMQYSWQYEHSTKKSKIFCKQHKHRYSQNSWI